jgi:hypothetical protein
MIAASERRKNCASSIILPREMHGKFRGKRLKLSYLHVEWEESSFLRLEPVLLDLTRFSSIFHKTNQEFRLDHIKSQLIPRNSKGKKKKFNTIR